MDNKPTTSYYITLIERLLNKLKIDVNSCVPYNKIFDIPSAKYVRSISNDAKKQLHDSQDERELNENTNN